MKIDIILEAGIAPAEVKRLGLLAEKLGVNTLWVSSFPAKRDAFLGAGALAAATTSMRVGVMPISPYEMHPLKIKDALLTLNEMCGGRAQILVGGLGKSVMNATGLQPTRRLTAVRDCMEILKLDAAYEPASYDGKDYSASHYFAPWAQASSPRLYVGANGPNMLRLTGEVADGVMMSDITLPHLTEMRGYLEEGLKKQEARWPDFHVNNFWAWHVNKDKDKARAEARRELVWRGALQRSHIRHFLTEEETDLVERNWHAFLQAFLTRTDKIEGIPNDTVDKLLHNLTFTGGIDDIDSIIKRVREFEAAGFSEFALRMHDDPESGIKLIGERVIPAVA